MPLLRRADALHMPVVVEIVPPRRIFSGVDGQSRDVSLVGGTGNAIVGQTLLIAVPHHPTVRGALDGEVFFWGAASGALFGRPKGKFTTLFPVGGSLVTQRWK